MIPTAIEAVTAFTATNIDDLVILMLLFSRLDHQFRGIHVVTGQCLGIAALVAASLIGFAGQAVLSQAWLGLMGLLPISLGLSQMVESLGPCNKGSTQSAEETAEELAAAPGLGWMGALGVATLTIINGSDNIGVYIPLFAHQDQAGIVLTLAVFGFLTAGWCLLGWSLTRLPALAPHLQRYGAACMPALLIGIGALILAESHTLQQQAQAVLALSLLAVMVMMTLRQLHELSTSPPV